jgi:hypothetical protein
MTRIPREHVWWGWKRENLSIALFALLLAMTPAMDMAHGSWTTPDSENENSGFSLASGTGFTSWDLGVYTTPVWECRECLVSCLW